MKKTVLSKIGLLFVLICIVGLPIFSYCQTGGMSKGGITSFSLDNPITIMSARSDAQGESYDNRYLGYFTILQLKPDLYYMYYECHGTKRYVYNHIAFAYSTDGINWIKSYPQGVTRTLYDDQGRLIINTNLIFFHDVREFDVVKVPDSEYPFRMVANEWIKRDKYKNETQLCMWKSKDGVNFEEKVVLLPSKHDTQPSIIIKGNIMKIYLRLRGPERLRERHVGYMYADLEGNMITPPTKLSDDLYYTSAASILDENREILFPTYFDQNHPNENHFEVGIVDNNVFYKIDADMSVLSKDGDKWGMVAPHIITINHSQYIAYHQANFDHTGYTDAEVEKTEIRLSKITFNSEGLPCPADPR